MSRRALKLLLLAVLVLASLTVAAWLTLHWGLLPRLEQWRPQIEQRASAALGQPVRIGAIRVSSHGWVPAFELQDVRLLDAQQRTVLHLGRVQAALAPAALLGLELRFRQLHLDGVQLDVRRDSQGRIRVAGLEAEGGDAGTDDGRAADWLFSQDEIVVRRGQIRWTDELRAAPALELADVDLVMRNGLRSHQLRLDATPPPDWGQRFSLIGQFRHSLLARRGQWRGWSGTLYAQLPAADVSQLRQHVELPFDLNQGRGAARAWLDLDRGLWRELTVDLALADVQARLASHLQPLSIAALRGRLSAARDAGSVAVRARGLSVTTAEGEAWPAGDIVLEWQQAQALAGNLPQGPVLGGRLKAEQLDLGVLGQLATRLPLGRALESTLASLAPAGMLRGLELRWTGTPDEPQRYQVQGQVSRLALAPLAAPDAKAVGRPGLAGADFDFQLSETGGKAQLSMQQGTLYFPGVFEDPSLPVTQLKAQLDWRVQRRASAPPAIELRVSDVRLANDDARAELQATWRTGKGTDFGRGGYLPGVIELEGRIVTAKADRVAAYLPLGIPSNVRHYVGRAVKGGRLDNGTITVKGDVWSIPFTDSQDGIFRIAGRLSDAQFDYLPSVPPGQSEPAWVSPWPGFTQVSGELLFDRSSMTLQRLQARLWGVQLRNIQARIDDMTQQPVLRVDGEGRGPLTDLLRFVEVSPVGGWIGGGLSTISAVGAGDLRLGLAIPLLQSDRTTVNGSIVLGGNDVQIQPGLPLLVGARGRVDFTQRGFQIVDASARALGGEFSLDGGTQPDGALRFQVRGTATAEGLKRAQEFAPLPWVAQSLKGQTSWRAQIGIVQGRPEISVSSDLVGLQSDWPAPFDKAAGTPLPMRWQTTLATAARPGDALRDQLRLDLGNLLQLRLQREWSGDQLRILSGAIGLAEPAPAAAAGQLLVRARLAKLDADAWSRTLERVPASVGEPLPALPRLAISLQAQELVALSRRVNQVKLELQQDAVSSEGLWQAQLTADQLAGRLSWRPPRGLTDGGRLVARLDRMSLPPAEPLQVEQLLDEAPSRLPALDILVEDFELRGLKLGRLNLQAASRAGSASGAWRLDKLELDMGEARLSAEGLWTPPPRGASAGRMQMDLGVTLNDAGRLAGRFGWPEAIRGGRGALKGQLAWAGSPLAPDLPTLDGALQLQLASGQFLRAEPGLGRLLGIVSLQSLPRRLLLDFRDVFQQGFAFDQVSGDIVLSRGQASFQRFHMRGVQATVVIEGSADLVREQQDLRVMIVPEVNAGAASLAYLAINPAIGLGTFFAQLLLRDPLRAAGTREFSVTGLMADPKVERVDRPINAPLPGPATGAGAGPTVTAGTGGPPLASVATIPSAGPPLPAASSPRAGGATPAASPPPEPRP
ncbi:MAG: TIGR02099 family protein [Rubrivivax sp.]|nr:TIGR02099 family protein [Rubrivivax sp.]